MREPVTTKVFSEVDFGAAAVDGDAAAPAGVATAAAAAAALAAAGASATAGADATTVCRASAGTALASEIDRQSAAAPHPVTRDILSCEF
ncbi:hypothetical protein MJ435_28375, partial [Burkholderia gladioli]